MGGIYVEARSACCKTHYGISVPLWILCTEALVFCCRIPASRAEATPKPGNSGQILLSLQQCPQVQHESRNHSLTQRKHQVLLLGAVLMSGVNLILVTSAIENSAFLDLHSPSLVIVECGQMLVINHTHTHTTFRLYIYHTPHFNKCRQHNST